MSAFNFTATPAQPPQQAQPSQPAFGFPQPQPQPQPFGAPAALPSLQTQAPLPLQSQIQPPLFQQPQQQQPQQPQQQAPRGPEAVYAAALRCHVFGDDRDALLARWNLLQGSWGSGKIHYSQSAPPIDVDGSNPLCRFKAMGYSVLPKKSASESEEVSLVVKMTPGQLDPLKGQMVTNLNQILGNKPNVKAHIVTIRPYGQDNLSEVVVYVTEEVGCPLFQNLFSLHSSFAMADEAIRVVICLFVFSR